MSGKEALEHIKKVNYYEDDEEIIEDCYGIEKDLDIIEKDLDALEILKTKPQLFGTKFKSGKSTMNIMIICANIMGNYQLRNG